MRVAALLRRASTLAFILAASPSCGDDGSPSGSGPADDDDGADTGGTSSTGTGTTLVSTSTTTDDPTEAPQWTSGGASSCIPMDGEGPCYVQSLVPVPSANLVYGDFDGDGALDFAAHDDGEPDRVLLFAGAGGSFADPEPLAFDPAPMHDAIAVSLAQLRLMDTATGPDRIFVQGTYGALGDVTIDMWWTDGGGLTRFYAPTQTPPAGPWFGDFDGSGDIDLAFAPGGNTLDPLDVHACDASGCGNPEAQTVPGAPAPPWTLLGGEVTGDARADLVAVRRTGTAGAYQSEVVVLRALASGFETTAAADLGPDLSAASVWLVEVTGDDALDLVVASDAGDTTDEENSRYLHVFEGDGAGGFAEAFVLDAEMNVRGLTVADFDGDGFPDLVARRSDTEVLDVYRGDGSGFTLGPRYAIDQVDTGQSGDAVGPWPTRVADLDGDGTLDVLTVVESDAAGLAVAVLLATTE